MSSEKPRKESSHRVFQKAKFGVDKLILVQKYKIHYVEAGAGEPVVLFPGSYSAYRAWNRLMPLLAEDYRLLLLDYTEEGETDKPDDTSAGIIQEQTDLLANMVRQMGLDRINLIGGSRDGAVIFDFAARYPDLTEKIISIEGGVIPRYKTPIGTAEYCLKLPIIGEITIRVARTGSLDKTESISEKWYSVVTCIGERESLKHISGKPETSSRMQYKINIIRRISRCIENEVQSIKTPVLYLYGTRPNYKEAMLDKNIEYLKNNLPHSWIVGLEEDIYDLALQNPGEVTSVIMEFLRKAPVRNN